jgi:hypothetical protein
MPYTEIEKAHLIAKAARDSRWHIFSNSKHELTFTIASCPPKFLVSRILDIRKLIEGNLGICCKITGGGYSCIEFTIGVDDPLFSADELGQILKREEISAYLENCGIERVRLGKGRCSASKKILFDYRCPA